MTFKTITILCICLNVYFSTSAQDSIQNRLLSEISDNACRCIDSINESDKSQAEIALEVNRCIDAQAGAYQIGVKLANVNLKDSALEAGQKKEITISVSFDKDSKEYKSYYYEMERYLMDSCSALKAKIISHNKKSSKSVSDNTRAIEFYNKGQAESEMQNFSKAVEYYKQALEIDPAFAFAWDNLGLCYRKLGEYDKALESYTKSLEIDPNGALPLQNIAIVFQYKKEYQNAIDAYQKLARVDKNNPEIYYGIGQIYATFLNDLEKGLDNMCKAYNMYIEQKSPYRTDAEKIINMIYKQMKSEGKEEKFIEILKANRISTGK